MKIEVTLRQIIESGYWNTFCLEYGVNEWCINEGVDDNSTYQITLREAKSWGLLDCVDETDRKEWQENDAKLIAHAPEILSELKYLVEKLESGIKNGYVKDLGGNISASLWRSGEILKKLK